MLTLIGIILLLGVVATFVLTRINEKAPDILPGKLRLVTGILGIVMILGSSALFYAEAGHSYMIVDPFGRKSAIMTEGYHVIWPYSKKYTYLKFIDIVAIGKGADEKAYEKARASAEGIMAPIPIRFIDQVTADVSTAVRVELPKDPESFIEMAVEFRSQDNLVENTLKPTISEQIINTGYMFSGQNYISGEAQQFRTTFEEQLKGGTYAVIKEELRDTTYDDGVANLDKARRIKEISIRHKVNKKIGPDGRPLRIPHELVENKIYISQVIVSKVDLDPDFQNRLKKQKDESAKRQIEQQKIETAKMTQARILAEGERDKAEERVNQEKEQVKKLIAIETELKQEETNRKLAEIQLETEKLLAKKEKVAAEAKAYKNRQLVNAGLTPQEKAEWEYKTKVDVAAQLSKIKLPTTMITGGGSNGKGTSQSILDAAMVKQLVDDKSK